MPTTVHSAFQRSLSTNAEKQVAARRHGAQQARHGSQSPRRRWPVSPLIRAGAVLVHVAGRVAGEDGGAHRDWRRPSGDRLRAETGPISIIWTAPLPAPRFSNSSTDQRPVAYGPISAWRRLLVLHRSAKRVGAVPA